MKTRGRRASLRLSRRSRRPRSSWTAPWLMTSRSEIPGVSEVCERVMTRAVGKSSGRVTVSQLSPFSVRESHDSKPTPRPWTATILWLLVNNITRAYDECRDAYSTVASAGSCTTPSSNRASCACGSTPPAISFLLLPLLLFLEPARFEPVLFERRPRRSARRQKDSTPIITRKRGETQVLRRGYHERAKQMQRGKRRRQM